MRVKLTCHYCGTQCEREISSQRELEDSACRICDQKEFSVKDITYSKVDYYKGCPPFPAKEKAKDIPDFAYGRYAGMDLGMD